MKRPMDNCNMRMKEEQERVVPDESLFRDVKLKRQRLSALLKKSSTLGQKSLRETCFSRIESHDCQQSSFITAQSESVVQAQPQRLQLADQPSQFDAQMKYEKKFEPLYADCAEVLDLSKKPASAVAANLRQHIGVSSAAYTPSLRQPSLPVAEQRTTLSSLPGRTTNQHTTSVITPRFHMASFVPTASTRFSNTPTAGLTNTTAIGLTATPPRIAFNQPTNHHRAEIDRSPIVAPMAPISNVTTSSRNKASDGVISSSSRNSQEWQKYVTPSRYSPLSGYCTTGGNSAGNLAGNLTGNSGGNSAGNSPYSSARSSPCRDMITDHRPVVNWTHLEQVKLLQEATLNNVNEGGRKSDREVQSCDICKDRATGLHYGIVSCEGCKGFFKRTVQNKRVYRCSSEGRCQVNKLRRNRCQYCRFQKCLDKGMVLAAVRDDRMPGGRNSGAVYNLYKVKQRLPEVNYSNTTTNVKINSNVDNDISAPVNVSTNQISEHNLVSVPTLNMLEVSHKLRLEQLLQCELNNNLIISRSMGDASYEVSKGEDLISFSQRITENCIRELYSWMKSLPMYEEKSYGDMQASMSNNWYAISLFTSVCQKQITGKQKDRSNTKHTPQLDLQQRNSDSMKLLLANMKKLLGREVSLDEMVTTSGQNVHITYWIQVITSLLCNIEAMSVTKSEYVCMKVIILLSKGDYMSGDHYDDYVDLLHRLVNNFEQGRFHKLMAIVKCIKAASSNMLDGHMMYLPFLMN